MVKALSYFKRKPGMSVEDFQAYWRRSHPAVVTKLAGIRRYVQSHTLPTAYTKGEPAYDGLAEELAMFLRRRPDLPVDGFQRYWREVHGLIAAAVPEVQRYVQSHVRRSAYERGRAPVILTREHVVIA